MTHIIFVGDVHLNPNIETREKSFCAFLDFVERVRPDQLFLMGDIFEFWFGYKTIMFAKTIKVVSKIYSLVDKGIEVTYIAGNHDFKLGPVFQSYIGVNVKDGPVITSVDDIKIYVSHGDEINKRDWGYRILKHILRNSVAQALFKLIPASIAWRIGLFTSKSSRKITSRKKGIPEDIYIEFLTKCIQNDIQIIIHGHTHQPGDEVMEINGKKIRVINSGHWFGPMYYVEYKDKQVGLKKWVG